MERKHTRTREVAVERIARILMERIRQGLSSSLDEEEYEWSFIIAEADLKAFWELLELARTDDRIWRMLKRELGPLAFSQQAKPTKESVTRSLQEVRQ